MPSPTSGCPNTAFSAQIRMSQLIASSQPPPSAKPFTAAITGMGKVSSLRNTSFPFLPNASPSAFVSVLISPMSAPATNDFAPAPVKIRQRTASRSTASSVASSSSSTCEFNAFKAFSRLIVMVPTAPFTSYNIKSILIILLLSTELYLFILLNNCRAAHAAADTKRCKTCLCALCFHLMKQRYQNTAS